MDSDNYQAYLDGDEYEYHGGFWDVSPITLEVPYDDYWYWITPVPTEDGNYGLGRRAVGCAGPDAGRDSVRPACTHA